MAANLKSIAIRGDASEKIGTGHVMRCLTLSEELRRRSCQVQFICRAHPGHMADMITKQGFQVSLLPESEHAPKNQEVEKDYTAWLGVSQEEDAKQTIEALGSDHPEWLIVDHYGLDNQWEKKLRPYIGNIMVIDDLANREHNCDLLLDQNYFQEPDTRYKGLLPDYSETLLGPQYSLLRPEFIEARKFCHMRGNGVAKILVYFGGNDPDNLTSKALEALTDSDLCHLFVDAVVGPNNPHLEKLEKQVQTRAGTRLYIQPEGFAELMLRADLCIGAGGTTTWERLCLNLPSLVITVAKNQEAFTEELNKSGYLNWIGRSQEMTIEIMKAALSDMISTLTISNNYFPAEIVDGRGVERVAEIIMAI